MPSYAEKITTLAQLLRSSQPAFAFTGAGMSTASGIPDFRSPGSGLWTRVDPARVSTLSVLRKDPHRFYEFNLPRWQSYRQANPNSGHLALAELERRGLLVGVITQNIDGLHRAAGSRRVWELHGNLRECYCLSCGEKDEFTVLAEKVGMGEIPPRCRRCGGTLRPAVVLFEDRMSEDYFQAVQVLSGCQLLLVLGSSLTVYPAAALPEKARRVVIVNHDPTAWDERAELVFRESIGRVLGDLLAELDGQPG